jgi:hypothetical protein
MSMAGFAGPVRGYELGTPIRSIVLERLDSGSLVSYRMTGNEQQRLVEVVLRYPDPWTRPRRPSLESDVGEVPLKPESAERMLHMQKHREDLEGTMRECRFVLDPGMNFAVREISEWREPNHMMFRTTCRDFERVEGANLWLPMRCDVESSANALRPLYVAPRPIYATSVRLTGITRQKFPVDAFRIWYNTPGVTVSDWTRGRGPDGGPLEYIVPVSGDRLGDVPPALFSRWWIVAANVLLFFIIMSVLIWKRMGTRQRNHLS